MKRGISVCGASLRWVITAKPEARQMARPSSAEVRRRSRRSRDASTIYQRISYRQRTPLAVSGVARSQPGRPCLIITSTNEVIVSLGGIVVSELDLRSTGRRFDSRPPGKWASRSHACAPVTRQSPFYGLRPLNGRRAVA